MNQKILNIYRYITEHIIANEDNANRFFMDSYTFLYKKIIFLYHDCAKVYIINHSQDKVFINSYFTIDYPDRLEFNMETCDGIDFEKFLSKYPKDENNSKEWSHEMTHEELSEFLNKNKNYNN